MVAAGIDEDTRAKVLRQVEFYFSDSNLPGDKFLLKCIDESEDGLVSLPLVCSFSRMRSHLGLQEHGPENVAPDIVAAVAEVLEKSSALRLSDDGTKVGRLSQLKSADEVQSEVNARSVAVNPLPWNITIDEVEGFFKQHAKVNSVRLPKLVGAKAFSGYATVELDSEDEAKRVLALKLEFQGAELEFEPKNEFDARQGQAHACDQPRYKNVQVMRNGSAGRDVEDDEDDYPKGLLVLFHLKKLVNPITDAAEVTKESLKFGGENSAKDEKGILESGDETNKEVVTDDMDTGDFSTTTTVAVLKSEEEHSTIEKVILSGMKNDSAPSDKVMEGEEMAPKTVTVEVLKIVEERTIASEVLVSADEVSGAATDMVSETEGENASVAPEELIGGEVTTVDKVMTSVEESTAVNSEVVTTETSKMVVTKVTIEEVVARDEETAPTTVEETLIERDAKEAQETINKVADSVAKETKDIADRVGDKDGKGKRFNSNVDFTLQVAREDIKGALEKFGKINFVDFARGDSSGYVRFDDAEAARAARDSAAHASDGGFIIKQHIVTLTAVEGETEKEYWKKLREGQGRRRESGGRGFNDRGRGRGGRPGRGRSVRGRGWHGDRNEERSNFSEARNKHKRFSASDGPRGKKFARTE